MAMELFIFVVAEASLSTESLNDISKKYGGSVVYEQKIDLKSHTGYLPVHLNGLKTGVETYVLDISSLKEHLPPNDAIHNDSLAIQLRWGGDMREGATALYTASIISATYNGVAFDPSSGMYLDSEQLMQGYEAFLQGL